MSAHTSPPWAFERAVDADGSVTFDIVAGSRDVAYLQTYAGQPLSEQEAIARMATAAPQMFAALVEIQARLMAHTALLDLSGADDCNISALHLELSIIVRVAREAAELAVQP